MILNACVRGKTMVDEKICRNCKDKNCRHAGQPTTDEAKQMIEDLYGDLMLWLETKIEQTVKEQKTFTIGTLEAFPTE